MQTEPCALTALEDRIAIVDAGYRFLWALDTRDWDRLNAGCTDGVAVTWDDPTGATRPKRPTGGG